MALAGLATAQKKDQVTQLLELLKRPSGDAGLARLLPYQTTEDLKKVRTQVASLAKESSSAETRQAALASLALADDSFDNVWPADSSTLVDMLYGISLIPDAGFRAKAYDKVKPLLAKAANPDSADRSAGPRTIRPRSSCQSRAR